MQSILVRSSHLKGSRLLNNSIFKNQSSTTLNKINIQNLQISRFFGNELKFKNNITKKNDLMNQNEQFNSFKKTNNNQSTTLFFKHASNRSFLSNFKQQSQSIIFNNNDFKYFSSKKAIPKPTNKVALTMKDVAKKLGDDFVFENVSIGFFKGAKIGILGPNGSGKSTLLKIIAGADTEFEGEVITSDGMTIGYLQQEPELDFDKNVGQNIMDGIPEEQRNTLSEFYELQEKIEREGDEVDKETKEKYLNQKEIVENQKLMDLARKVEVAIHALKCPPSHFSVANLSGGEKRRVALCRLLISNPQMLCLDEPTNHLDAQSVAWLEKYLASFPGTVVAITHDRYFLDNLTQWILEIDRGKVYGFQGNYTEWLTNKQKRLAIEDKTDEGRKRHLDRELDWIRSTPKAGRGKNKARVAQYEKLVEEAAARKQISKGTIVIPTGPRLGKVVAEAKNISKSYNGKVLLKDVSFEIPSGAIVGIVGGNGVGKTTLFNMIAGLDTPDSGSLRLGESVKFAYVNQIRSEDLDPERTVYEEISEGDDVIQVGDLQVNARHYVASFGFQGQSQKKLIGFLSGGERNRVQVAKILKHGANLLMMDEPTNDLDVEVLRSLEEALTEFAGTALVISHDRWFLNRTCTHIMVFEGNGKVTLSPGNYSDYELTHPPPPVSNRFAKIQSV